MPIGPGKYDPVCTLVREMTSAKGAIVIVFDGQHGDGFSCQADVETTLRLPEVLEHMARQMRADMEKGK